MKLILVSSKNKWWNTSIYVTSLLEVIKGQIKTIVFLRDIYNNYIKFRKSFYIFMCLKLFNWCKEIMSFIYKWRRDNISCKWWKIWINFLSLFVLWLSFFPNTLFQRNLNILVKPFISPFQNIFLLCTQYYIPF
jgi:hypothetical protein